MTNKTKKSLRGNHGMTIPTVIRHPGIAELSINKMRLNNNLRRLSVRILDYQEGRRRNKVRPKPNILSRT